MLFRSRDASLLRCCFGTSTCVAPRRASDVELVCTVPALDASVDVSVSVNGGVDRSTPVRFHMWDAEPAFTGLSPATGSLSGGTVVHIRGEHFGGDDAVCRFDGIEVKASLVTAEHVACVSPSLQSAGDVQVEVALNSVDFTKVPGAFRAAPLPTVLGASPSIIVNGPARITVSGRGFAEGPLLACRFGDVSVRAAFASADTLHCVAPAGPPRTKVCVDVSLNGVDFAGECRASVSYAGTPRALAANASLRGDLAVAYDEDDLEAWAAAPDLVCTFGNVSRPAAVVDGRVVCRAPNAPPASLMALNVTEVPLGVGSLTTDLSYTFGAPLAVRGIAPQIGRAHV